MKINVGSKNQNKVNAVKEIVVDYDFLSHAEVISLDASSEVSNQPKTLEETIQGAMRRAKNCFQDCELSFGIEDGLMKVPNTKSGYMNICVCSIFDGKEYHLGISSAFEYPSGVTDLIFKEGLEVDEAVHKLGITKDKRIGYAGGMIGLLTKGRLKRKDNIKEAVRTALIHLENADYYKKQ
ncbi:MAG: inosine/xanthosine triphosphatase [Candidatus Aenigmatarchaeota archaeon]|nr:inosine/xanthosine triphosphatase [Nanoarchaeota archaeon]